ncbi:OmpA family protein [Porphyromonas asaccharolytica]|uniref:OmpA/MotB domain protein n=1 Tax=Porphyromonas asaccharolytica (strain ATCC 25260 / DSM 20707 / BCRC 10618 / CCUG 7834 / JCM 6326 / LMG 13178 / VPI 4198 / B440) TaxID=879243 RepID=F4KP27_PORAD|nr:OmpA family protein [Porphyromonas asaccharolytica]AEE13556.1 OmpA/MotB domain protein [Porphyromonas asaccharolytica DSM 20707]
MKAKVFMLSLVVALTAFVAQAQEAPEVDNRPAYKTEFEQDPAAHWFIELHGGAAMLPFGNKANGDAEFVDRISPVVSLSLGRWHSPYFATRLRGYAWNVYSFEKPANEVVRYQNVFGAASLEFMFDVVNYFAPYRENRVFHLVPFVGLGAHMKFYSADDKSGDRVGTENDLSGLFNGGLALKFRLGKRVDLNLEGQMMVSKNNFKGTLTAHNPADVTALVSAGLTFKLGRVAFQPITPMDYELVNDLNGQISSLRAQNAELSKRPVSCPECPDALAPATAVNVIENVVAFRIGSAKIDKNQMINVYNSAEAAKANGGKIYIVGYADEQTGTPEINMSLSERRAEAVKNALINNYGVNPDNIVIDFKGDTVQPFATNEWNRVAIISIK